MLGFEVLSATLQRPEALAGPSAYVLSSNMRRPCYQLQSFLFPLDLCSMWLPACRPAAHSCTAQMFGSSMANGTGSSATSGAARRSLAGGAESPSHTSSDAGPAGLDALSCLPAERAEQWRQRIM